MVIHYCRQYPEWVEQLEALTDTARAIRYDVDHVQTSNDSDPTSDLAMRRAEISRKKEMIDKLAVEIGGIMAKWLIRGVCYGDPFYQLKHDGIPCGKDLYYLLRRKFYYEMSRKV